MKIEQMYVLMDGTQADPDDCARDKDGVLRHKNGVKVAIAGDGKPETVGDRTAMNSLAAGQRAGERQPRPEVDRPPAGEAPKADGDKPADPEPTPPIAGDAAAGGQQQSPGSEKPQE